MLTEYCEKCGKNVEVDVLDIDYNCPDCFMRITFKCKECGTIGHVEVKQ